MSGIETVDRGPAVEAFPYVRRNTLFAREANEERDKSMITDAVNRRRKAQHRHARSCRGGRSRSLF